MKTGQSSYLFHLFFSGMATALLSIAGWIAVSVAHLPGIEQKLDDYINQATTELSDHEARIRKIELDRKGA